MKPAKLTITSAFYRACALLFLPVSVFSQHIEKKALLPECTHNVIHGQAVMWATACEQLSEKHNITLEEARRFVQFLKTNKMTESNVGLNKDELVSTCLNLYASSANTQEYHDFVLEKEKQTAQPVPYTGGAICNNLDFSNGTTSGWSGTWNSNGLQDPSNNGFGLNSTIGLNSGAYNSIYTVHQLCTPGLDRIVPVNRVPPGHTYSMRLGSDSASTTSAGAYNHQTASNTFLVTAQNCILTFWYAVMFSQTQGNPHPSADQPYFKVSVVAGGTEVGCAKYGENCTSATTAPGWQKQNPYSAYCPSMAHEVIYKDWTPVMIPLTAYIGQTVTITFETSDCNGVRHFGYTYFAVDCGMPQLTVNSQLCLGSSTTITAPPGATSYQWSGPGIVGSSTGSTVTVNSPGNYTATMTTTGISSISCSYSLSTQVNLPAVTQFANFTANSPCVTSAASFTNTSAVSLTSWNWIFGDGQTNNSNQNPSHTYASAGTYTVSLIGTDQYGCKDTTTKTLVVKPNPVLSAISNQTVCAGSTIAATNFSTTPSGATINWTNSNVLIGLTSSGSGNISAYTAPSVSTPTSATITATPTLNGCTGSTQSFNIVVNPQPQLTSVNNQTVCSGATVTGINFTATPSGGSVNWTNSSTLIGLAGSGNGNIPAYTAPLVSTQTSATITATATLNGCAGIAQSFNIVVNPQPQLTSVNNQAVCSGATVTGINFATTPSGGSANWTNSNISIGLSGSGSGNIPAYTAPVVSTQTNATITATATLNGCTGSTQSFNIVVNPQPQLTSVNNQAVCSGATVTGINFTTTPSGGSVNWTNSNGLIGLAASGSGNIPAYIAPAVNATETAIITVTPLLNNCTGASGTFTLSINPVPVLNVSGQSVCSGNEVAAINFSSIPAGAAIAWTNSNTAIGIAASGTGDIAAYTAPVTNTPLSATISAVPTLNGCVGSTQSCTINISPQPQLSSISNQSVCSGTSTSAIVFNTMPAGSSFSWTNSNTAIGLQVSGSGNIAAYTAPNVSTNETGTISVIPSLNGCVGASQTFNITVNPSPVLNTVVNQTVCSGVNINPVNFVSTPAGAINQWINSNTAIGLPASGSGNIASYVAPTVSSQETATITITPQLNGCTGSPQIFTISIQPNPQVNVVSNQTVCGGTQVNGINFSSVPAGASVSWNNSNTAIGLAASGNGNIAAFVAPAVLQTQQAVITVSPVLNACAGPAASFTITLNANPQVNGNPIVDTASCGILNGGVSGIAVSGGTAPYQYQWYNGSTPITGANQATLSNVGSGTYSVTVTDANNCLAVGAPTAIVIPTAPQVVSNFNASASQGTAPLVVDFTNASSGANVYSWIVGNSVNSNQVNMQYNFTQNGTYTVSLIATHGACSDTSMKVIVVDVASTIVIPNIFSPNQDGINDHFAITNTGLSTLNCTIFNRWGQLVYTIDSPHGVWDGRMNNGNDASDGTYYYFVKANGTDGKEYAMQGALMLVK